MALTDRKPTGLLRIARHSPIWVYRAGLGRLLGHRLLYLAHRGRRTDLRREVVVETVRFDPSVPEAIVIAAWGRDPDWYRNLQASPAFEVRVGGHRWLAPEHRFLYAEEILGVLLDYRLADPYAWNRLAPLLGLPADLTDPRWAEISTSIHAVAFTPKRPDRSS